VTLLVDLLLWAIVITLGLTLASRSKTIFSEAVRNGLADFASLMPRITIGFIGSGYLAAVLPQHLMVGWFGAGSGLTGLGFAAVAGALTPGGPVIGFALATTALKAGAGAPQVIAYTIAWALFAVQRVVLYELPVMPSRVVWIRCLVSLPLPFLAAWAAMIVGKP
jgi:hypothetical protein